MQPDNLRLKMSRHNSIYGLLLFAATWGVIPIIVTCVTYRIPSNRLWLAVSINGMCYFLSGLLIGLLLFGCLRLWLVWRRNQGEWLIPILVFSLVLCVLEVTFMHASLIIVASQMIGLIVSGISSSAYWPAVEATPLK